MATAFVCFDELGAEDFQVIFLTAYDQYAIQALKYGLLWLPAKAYR
jgi:two-component system LytT family response regulator